MATGKITLDEGTTTNTATNTISEDAVTKHIPRSVLNTSAGVEVDLAGQLGALTETAPASDTASSGLNGRLQRIAQRLTSIIALLPGSLGQKARAASFAVTLSSEDVTALTPPAAITGFATAANQTTAEGLYGALTETAPATDTASSGMNGRLQRVAQRLTSIIALLPASLGQKARASSLATTLSTEDITALTPPAAITGFATEATLDARSGSLTETAPATDTASSGLNGRMQRVAQRLTSLIALLPASLGQKARASSLAVTLSSEDVTALTPVAAITGFATEATLDARTGSLTETAPASDTASSGLNGRLQRIAQRLTSILAKQPALGTAGSSSTDVLSVQGIASGTAMPVSVASIPSHAVTNAGTFAVQGAGDVAHDAVDSGSPVKTGGQARTTLPTAVADADRVNFIADKHGRQVVTESIRDLRVTQQTTITSSTSETTILTAVASTFLDVYGLVITNTSATVCKVTIKDDTAGTTRFVFEIPATETRGFMLTPGGAHPQAVVNKPWTATCGTSVAAIEITVMAVKTT